MMVRVLAVLAALCVATPAAAQRPLIADMSPAPTLSYGMKKQKASYTGLLAQVYNPVQVAAQDFGMTASGDFDAAAMDTFLNGNTGLVTLWFDQQSGVALAGDLFISLAGTITQGSAVVTGIATAGLAARMAVYGNGINFSTVTSSIDGPTQLTLNQPALITGTVTLFFVNTPAIRDHTVGNARSIIVQGANMSGARFGLKTLIDLSLLGITAKDYSVVAVVRPTSSMFTNQAGAPGNWRGAFWQLNNASSGNVAWAMNDSRQGYRGAIYVSDQNGLDFWTPQTWVPIMPMVLSVTSRNGIGLEVCMNNDCRSGTFVSPLTRTATELLLGMTKLGTPGATSDSGGFEVVSLNVWSSGLTPAQRAEAQSILAQSYGIDLHNNRYDRNFFAMTGDSISSGYTVLGLYGYMMYIQPMLTQPTAVGSYGVPGSTIMNNPLQPAGTGPTSTVGLVQPALCELLHAGAAGSNFTKARIVGIHGGGNDALLSLGPIPPRNGVTAAGNATITGIGNTADISVGDMVFASNITWPAPPGLVTVQSKTASSITLTGATPSTSATVSLLFLSSAFSPTNVFNNILTTKNTLLACGATNVIVVTINKRNEVYQPFVNNVNDLIVNDASGTFTKADCRNFGNLGVNPGPDYFDSGHMSEAGNLDMANCLKGFVNPLLQP